MPHRSSAFREGERYGYSGRADGEPSFGSSGSYGRSQGAGSFGGGREDYRGGREDYRGGREGYGGDTGAAWSTGGDSGGETSFGPRGNWGTGTGSGTRQSFWGRGPKDYRRSDERIREDVSDRLEQDHGVDASDVTVQVQNGEVTFTGTVTSRDQKRRAEDCAESVSGVREVINNLRLARSDGRGETASAGDVSSSLLGLGGQPSREDENKPVSQVAGAGKSTDGKGQDGTQGKAGRSSSSTSGSSGLSA